jgi:hypothetical protein
MSILSIDRDHPYWIGAMQPWRNATPPAGGWSNAGTPRFSGQSLISTQRKGSRPGLIRSQETGTSEHPYYSVATHGLTAQPATDEAWWIQAEGARSPASGLVYNVLVPSEYGDLTYTYPDEDLAAILALPVADRPMASAGRPRLNNSGARGRHQLFYSYLFKEATTPATESPNAITPLLYRESPGSAEYLGSFGQIFDWAWDPGTEQWSSSWGSYTGGGFILGTFLRVATRDPTTGVISFTAWPECGDIFEGKLNAITGPFEDSGGQRYLALTTPVGWRKSRMLCAGIPGGYEDPVYENVRVETRLVYHDRFERKYYGEVQPGDNSNIGYTPTFIGAAEVPWDGENLYPYNVIEDIGNPDRGWSTACVEINTTTTEEWRDISPSIPYGDHIICAGCTLKYTAFGSDYSIPFQPPGDGVSLLLDPAAAECPARIFVRGGGVF